MRFLYNLVGQMWGKMTKWKSQVLENEALATYKSDPYRIQTCNLLIRSQTLYSIELRDHFSFLALQSYCYFLNWQAFWATFFKKKYHTRHQQALSYTMPAT